MAAAPMPRRAAASESAGRIASAVSPPRKSNDQVALAHDTGNQTAGFDHVNPHRGHDLPAIPQGRSRGFDKRLGKAMIEAATALLAFLSVGVFLAHAFDAYRMR